MFKRGRLNIKAIIAGASGSIIVGLTYSGYTLWKEHHDEKKERLTKLEEIFAKKNFVNAMGKVEAWRNKDPNFTVFVAYQTRYKKDPSFKDSKLTIDGKDRDFAATELNYKNWDECYDSFDFCRKCVRKMKVNSELKGVSDTYYLSKDELSKFIRRPHMGNFLHVIQHADKVNCNNGPYYYEGRKSSWKNPGSSRPSFYEWAERVYKFTSIPETAFSNNDKPVEYKTNGHH